MRRIMGAPGLIEALNVITGTTLGPFSRDRLASGPKLPVDSKDHSEPVILDRPIIGTDYRTVTSRRISGDVGKRILEGFEIASSNTRIVRQQSGRG